MRRPTWSDLNRLSAALAELYAPGGLDLFPSRLIGAMQQLIPSDICFYNEFGPQHFRVVDEPRVLTPQLTEGFLAQMHEHPTLQHVLQTGSNEPVMFSDFVSLREFRQTGIHREFFGRIGIDSQLAGGVQVGGMTITYAFNRGSRTYREEDRLLAGLLAQHLAQARRNAELWSIRLAAELGGAPVMLGIDADMRIRVASEAASRLLRSYFPRDRNPLPDRIARWVRAQRNNWGTVGTPPSQPLRIEASHGELAIHCVPAGADGIEYLLMAETVAPSPQQLEQLGLTQREAEILFWVSEGKRNAEIAAILGSTARTVSKHLEHIFAKLGVETRAAAGSVAARVLGGTKPRTHVL